MKIIIVVLFFARSSEFTGKQGKGIDKNINWRLSGKKKQDTGLTKDGVVLVLCSGGQVKIFFQKRGFSE